MVTIPQTLNAYSEQITSSSLPILGVLAWFTVPEDSSIDYKDFVELVTRCKAPVNQLPSVPQPADVFRRACNSSKLLKQPTGNPERFLNYVLRDASYDTEYVFRQLVEELVDTEAHRLGFRVLGTYRFARETSKIYFHPEDDITTDDNAMGAIDTVSARLDEYLQERLTMLPAIAIREAARKALEVTLRGTKVRPGGGVYFVSPDHMEEAERLCHAINEVPGAHFHILPLIDDTNQREMLRASFQTEAIDSANDLIVDMTELINRNGRIQARTFTNLQDRIKELKDRHSEYSDLLSDSLADSETALKLVNTHFKKVFSIAMSDPD